MSDNRFSSSENDWKSKLTDAELQAREVEELYQTFQEKMKFLENYVDATDEMRENCRKVAQESLFSEIGRLSDPDRAMERIRGLLENQSGTRRAPELLRLIDGVFDAFENVECYMVPRPSEHVLRASGEIRAGDCGSDFLMGLCGAANHVLNNLVAKKVMGTELTGSTLKQYVEACGIGIALNGDEDDLINCFKPDGPIPSGLQAMRNARTETEIEDLLEPLASTGFQGHRGIDDQENDEFIDSDNLVEHIRDNHHKAIGSAFAATSQLYFEKARSASNETFAKLYEQLVRLHNHRPIKPNEYNEAIQHIVEETFKEYQTHPLFGSTELKAKEFESFQRSLLDRCHEKEENNRQRYRDVQMADAVNGSYEIYEKEMKPDFLETLLGNKEKKINYVNERHANAFPMAMDNF
ncbi:unnamed protein product, partial [Mesorhabditis belari]|uniref:Uncharacterized protein n=1 Tax=Mesorhabditis belari TaxID=2138241 RepID=A0AAF3F9A4_9BILA